jgi:hypothetical protein
MLKGSFVLLVILFASFAWPQDHPKKYPWQDGDTSCTKWMTFCWFGSETVSDPEVAAHGNRWISQDKDENPLEWVTEVRCIQKLHACILARNQRVLNGTVTNIDMYRVEEWSNYQVRSVGESGFPQGKECEIDSLLLNREEASVSMIEVPGPDATTKVCLGIMKPKTVIYKLEIGSPKF